MKILLRITAFVLLLFSVTIASAKDKEIPFAELPTKAQTFVKQHFSEKDVAVAKVDTEYLIVDEYEVILKNGSKIEFDSDGNWKKVDMKDGKAVPRALVLPAISQHIQKSFPNTFVKEIKKKRKGYEVEISNGLELEFSKDGTFIRIDD